MTDLLVNFFAPWAAWYADSTLLAAGVTFLHLAGLLWGGGRAVVADAMTLRAADAESFLGGGRLEFLRASHRDVLVGLGFSVGSGILLFGSDVAEHLGSPVYWVKMAGVAALLGNGALLRRLEAPLAAGGEPAAKAWPKLRGHAMASLALWFAVMLLGELVVGT